MFLVLHVLLTVGILLNRYLGDLFLISLKKCKVSYTIDVVVRIPNLVLDRVFFLEEPLIAPVIASAALY